MSNSRFGFNGQEKDNEIKGIGNSLDFTERIYDSRLGKFLSIDGLTAKYPWYTPYQFAGNTPIQAIDIDGLEECIMTFRFEDGRATQLKTVKNSYIVREKQVVNRYATYKDVIYDKRTGKPMEQSQIGQVQYQYKDGDGNSLNIRRDYDGNYVPGNNEMMPLGANNLLGSVYIGPVNPTYTDENGETQADYRREPQDEVDAAALKHDQAYDALGASGPKSAFFDEATLGADKALVKDAQAVINKGTTGTDNVTGKKVTGRTRSRAKKVKALFNIITKSKSSTFDWKDIKFPTGPNKF